MTNELLTAIVAGASAIGGGAIVAGSNYSINRAQARDAQQAELRTVLTSFIALINRVDHQLRIEPNPGQFVRWLNEQMARFPQLDYTIAQARRRLFEPHLDSLVINMHDGMAAMLLTAPDGLMGPLERISLRMETAAEADGEWRQRWEAARTDLVVACRRTLQARPTLRQRVKQLVRNGDPAWRQIPNPAHAGEQTPENRAD